LHCRPVGRAVTEDGRSGVGIQTTRGDIRRVRVILCVVQHPGIGEALGPAINVTRNVKREPVIVVLLLQLPCQLKLFQIARAGDGLCLVFRLGQRWQQKRGENGDDGDDHEKSDEGEARVRSSGRDLTRFVLSRS
jgi:hypothetical protein